MSHPVSKSSPESDLADDPSITSASDPTPSHRLPTERAGQSHAEPGSDWPQFRGPDGQGHATATGLPVRWNEKQNIVWKVPLRASGWSSPVIADNQIWLTAAAVSEKSLRVLCLDRETGSTLIDREVFHKDILGKIHSKNSHASPTPILANGLCYVHFGRHGTAALDLLGNIVWQHDLMYYHHHGPASSPVLDSGMLFIACDGLAGPYYDDRKIGGITDPQFVVALDAATGRERWRTSRKGGAHSYATPLVIEVAGRKQLVSPGGNSVVAYDLSTGAEIWSCTYQGYSVVPRPVYGHGLVYVCTGYDVPTLLAIRPTGQGDVTGTHVAWKANQAVPFNPSPILIDDELYTVSDQGVVSCLDARTGKLHWRKRVGGNHSASPVFADGKLYVVDEAGTTHVLAPGTKYRILAKNLLRGKTLSSLAVSGRSLFMRTDAYLYRIAEVAGNGGEPDSAETPDESDQAAPQ